MSMSTEVHHPIFCTGFSAELVPFCLSKGHLTRTPLVRHNSREAAADVQQSLVPQKQSKPNTGSAEEEFHYYWTLLGGKQVHFPVHLPAILLVTCQPV